MRITRAIGETREAIGAARRMGQRIGLIPTMGYLHEGHASLIELCKNHADYSVVSVFVNPTQFSPQEDFARYPRDFERDRQLIETHGAHLLFTPAVAEIYPEDSHTDLSIQRLADHLCGPKRPGHFQGVLLIVAKLFHIVEPDVAVFGQKDLQQLIIIKRMVNDLNFPITIIATPTLREPDGLAMSSRNSYLSAEERQRSTVLYRALEHAKRVIESGEHKASAVIETMTQMISAIQGLHIDYIEIVELEHLQPIEELQGQVAIALAVYLGKTRLIDNIVLEVLHGKDREIPAIH